MPASYHHYAAHGKYIVASPTDNVPAFVKSELSLRRLGEMIKHLWFAGSKRPTLQLHFQVALGREIVVVERMDLHLLWNNNGRLFLKPVPRFLLDPDFWRSNLKCLHPCPCQTRPVSCRREPRAIASGFLYTYACLLSSESDFHLANEKRLLPRKEKDAPIEWRDWKKFARELLEAYDPDQVHPRFLRGELRLSRINIIHRFTRLPPFDPYIRGWRNYGHLFRANLAWMAAVTVYMVLVLSAMQVGLATEKLQGDVAFQQASYGFAVFTILGPMLVFGLVVLAALFNLAKDLPGLLGRMEVRRMEQHSASED